MSKVAKASLIALVIGGLAACSGGGTPAAAPATEQTTSAVDTAASTPVAAPTAPVETAMTTPPAAPVSDIDAAVQKVVGVLDQLGIKHTAPTRTQAGLGSKASFDITIDGFEAGINIFVDADSLKAWQDASDSFGGVDVSFDNAALSLNSSDGIQDSVKIAPQIAAAIGGTAHGV